MRNDPVDFTARGRELRELGRTQREERYDIVSSQERERKALQEALKLPASTREKIRTKAREIRKALLDGVSSEGGREILRPHGAPEKPPTPPIDLGLRTESGTVPAKVYENAKKLGINNREVVDKIWEHRKSTEVADVYASTLVDLQGSSPRVKGGTRHLHADKLEHRTYEMLVSSGAIYFQEGKMFVSGSIEETAARKPDPKKEREAPHYSQAVAEELRENMPAIEGLMHQLDHEINNEQRRIRYIGRFSRGRKGPNSALLKSQENLRIVKSKRALFRNYKRNFDAARKEEQGIRARNAALEEFVSQHGGTIDAGRDQAAVEEIAWNTTEGASRPLFHGERVAGEHGGGAQTVSTRHEYIDLVQTQNKKVEDTDFRHARDQYDFRQAGYEREARHRDNSSSGSSPSGGYERGRSPGLSGLSPQPLASNDIGEGIQVFNPTDIERIDDDMLLKGRSITAASHGQPMSYLKYKYMYATETDKRRADSAYAAFHKNNPAASSDSNVSHAQKGLILLVEELREMDLLYNGKVSQNEPTLRQLAQELSTKPEGGALRIGAGLWENDLSELFTYKGKLDPPGVSSKVMQHHDRLLSEVEEMLDLHSRGMDMSERVEELPGYYQKKFQERARSIPPIKPNWI